MADQKDYTRQQGGARFILQGGMNLYRTVDLLNEGEYAYLQNVRRYLDGRIVGRATMGDALFTVGGIPHTIRRMNDLTPAGPVSGYVRVVGAGGVMYVDAASVAAGLSGNPVSLCPFRPNTSVQPWMYVGDSAAMGSTSLTTKYAINDAPVTFTSNGMMKIRSDGRTYKMGIKEPQAPPVVSTTGTTTSGSASLPATTIPWTNVGGVNPSYNYGHSNVADGTAPVIISTPAGAQSLALTVTGTATVNGVSASPGDAGATTSAYPGHYIYPGGGVAAASIVVAAFTDSSGNVIAGSSGSPNPVDVGAGTTLTVPSGATRCQIGINSSGNTFSANSGSFSISWTLTTSAISTKISTLGDVTTYYWGDSPHSGPVAEYIWKNPNDSTSSGISRTSSTAKGSVDNNSWQFDSSPEDGTVPMLWDTLDSAGTVTGSLPVFSPALETQGYQDFNMCVCGALFVPTAGDYSFTFVNKDQIMVGIGGGVTSSSSATMGPFGQSMTVVNSLPLVYVSTPSGGGGAVTQTVTITFPASGSYQMEIDFDYWYHTGRKLNVTINGAVIPPLPSGARTNTSYACKYRSSLTGAVSNPGPASDPQVTPVLDNEITCPYSDDPQVDKVDYYRQDSGLANYTYVGTGPNTNPPTPISDTLSDLEVATNPTMDLDDFEPFPSIDLPKAGTVNVSGGTITWVSGDTFNVRWLPGTVIEIGYPTQIAYSLYTRPASTTTMYIPDVPDGTGLVYNIAEPILAAQPLPYMWGPTDNTAYMFGCGDPLRPGTLYFTKGNNPDSAPDSNQIEVTSPSEPLMNGVIVNGIGMVFSTEHAWLIYPTYVTALANVSGISGQPFNLIQSITNCGLYIPNAICTEAGMNVFFRAKDGIYVSAGGAGSESITDAQLFNLFPNEGMVPSPVTLGGYTVWPPDDTQPHLQRLSFANGYLYYDYGYNYTAIPELTANFAPASVTQSGGFIPWQLPQNALGTGIGEGNNYPVAITGFSISDNVISFTTNPLQIPLVAGQQVTIDAMQAATYLEGETFTVLSSGLSDTTFSAAYTHADVASALDWGIAISDTTYTFADNLGGQPVGPGEYVAYGYPSNYGGVGTSRSGGCFFAPYAWYGYAMGGAGVNGCPGVPGVITNTGNVVPPVLPAGAVVQAIIPMGKGTRVGGGVTAQFFLVLPGNPFSPAEVGMTGSVYSFGSQGTDMSVIPGYYFYFVIGSSVPGSTPYDYSVVVDWAKVAVVYTLPTGTPISPTQLNTLSATDMGLAIPPSALINGVSVSFSTGMSVGTSADLTAQLTLNGVPVGDVQSIVVGSWATDYTIGSSTFLWGLGSLAGVQVNGPTGLGVNISGDLPDGSKIYLNNIHGTVNYTGVSPVTFTGRATLVYDVAAKGWSVDVGNPNFSVHALDEGPNVNDTVVGCIDSSVRVLGSNGTEITTSVVATPAINAGDARAFKRVGDVFIKGLVTASNPLSLTLYSDRYQSALTGYSPTSITGAGIVAPYIVDFTNGEAVDLIDIEAIFSWNTASENYLDLWQPNFIPLPESTQDRPTDWDDAGSPGNKFVQGLMLEADTFNLPKTFVIQRSDDLALFTPNEVPVVFNKQSIKPFTFTPPFLAHSMRIISTDGVPWNHAPGVGWKMNWVFVPYPESTVEWQTEMISNGLRGWQHIRAMNIAFQSTTNLTLTLVFDQWPTITLTIPNSGGVQTKQWVQMPPNKFKLVSYRLSSTEPFYLWQQDIEVYVKWWGDMGGYQLLKPFGGPSNDGALV